MALILAIEPDKRQAANLAASVRGHLDAELVLGASADEALPHLAGRVPDLVLTTALLSPKDDAALATWLGQLGTSAAYLQTLTIPVLGSAQSAPRKRGVLSALRRGRAKEADNGGCDPAVFAEQVADYLNRAAAEREELSELFELEAAREEAEASEMLPEDAPAELDAVTFVGSESNLQPDSDIEPDPKAEPDLIVEPEPAYAATVDEEPALAVAEDAVPAAMPSVEEPVSLFIDPVELVAEPAEEPDTLVVEPASLEPVEIEAADAMHAAEMVEAAAYVDAPAPDEASRIAASEAPDGAPPSRDPIEHWMPTHSGLAGLWPKLEGGMAVAPMPAHTRAEDARTVRERREARERRRREQGAPEWRAILDGLRRDVETLRASEQPKAPLEPLPPINLPRPARVPTPRVVPPVVAAPRPVAARPVSAAPRPAVTRPPAPRPATVPAPHGSQAPRPAPAPALRPPAAIPRIAPAPARAVTTGAPRALVSPAPAVASARVARADAVAAPAAASRAATASAGVRREPPKTKVQPAQKPRPPVQDEWGLFDPEQCGFAALLAKLKEATKKEEAAETSDEPLVR
jgi:hypothetical protein